VGTRGVGRSTGCGTLAASLLGHEGAGVPWEIGTGGRTVGRGRPTLAAWTSPPSWQFLGRYMMKMSLPIVEAVFFFTVVDPIVKLLPSL
jgi:hypothetical protein